MRLIDADLFIKEKTVLYCGKCERRMGMKNGKKTFVYEIGDAPCRACEVMDMLIDIEDAPTVEERPKGTIIKTTSTINPDLTLTYFNCSECNELIGEYDNYCKRCGADMMKGEEE